MTNRKDQRRSSPFAEKTSWHPYGLQSLSQRQFVDVVGKILRREHTLISVRSLPSPTD